MSDEQHEDDPRPKPRYGELAPEGWSWSPPDDQERLDTSRGARPDDPEQEPGDADPRVDSGPGAPGWSPPGPYGQGRAPGGPHAGTAHYAAGSVPAGATGHAPYWNRPLTFVLVLVGLFGALVTISTLSALPQSIQVLYTSQHLGTYHPAADLPTIILAGQIVQGLLWVASMIISTLLMSRQRISFYVPLVAGVLAMIALFVFLGAVVAGDPTLLNAYSGA